jgi:glutamate/tyrosine decarboxylase-like PLP-dependent enzyme
VTDPLQDRHQLSQLLTEVAEAASQYFDRVDGLPAGPGAGGEAAALAFGGALPEDGNGSIETLRRLLSEGMRGSVNSAGPRFFHFVTGGSTPAALSADWLASALDNNAGLWISSPIGSRIEQLALNWLKDLFRLPADWAGVLTTGATMSNFTALGAARQWWGEQHGVDLASQGMSGLPPVPVFSGGFIHASARKALSMLGIGHQQVKLMTRDRAGRIDLDALEHELRNLSGKPALVLATAGEVNAGGFDPIETMAQLSRRYHAWLHVDGAFGLFARVSPETAELARGVELADSVIADGHKWLNVPYDCGFAFVRDGRFLASVFGMGAPYFPPAEVQRPDFLYLGPEMSRRARAFSVWATLAAYGRSGYRAMVERHIGLAARVGQQIRASEDFELLEEPRLNVICFRYRPHGFPETELDELNRRLGAAIITDGRVYFGTTVYADKVAFRPAISNYRTTEQDVDVILPIARELGSKLLTHAS